MTGGRRGETSRDFAAGGRRRLNLDGFGEAAGRFVMEDAGDEIGNSISLSFPFVRGTGSSDTGAWTGSGSATSMLSGEGNSVLVCELLVVGEEGRSLECTISVLGARVLSVTTVMTLGYSVETARTFSHSKYSCGRVDVGAGIEGTIDVMLDGRDMGGGETLGAS